jgi:hypothetical protein
MARGVGAGERVGVSLTPAGLGGALTGARRGGEANAEVEAWARARRACAGAAGLRDGRASFVSSTFGAAEATPAGIDAVALATGTATGELGTLAAAFGESDRFASELQIAMAASTPNSAAKIKTVPTWREDDLGTLSRAEDMSTAGVSDMIPDCTLSVGNEPKLNSSVAPSISESCLSMTLLMVCRSWSNMSAIMAPMSRSGIR